MRMGSLRIEELVGRGGMASVWRAVHDGGQTVAVKVISERYAGDERYRSAFGREVQAVAGIEHPGIVRVFDYRQIAEHEAAALPADFVVGAPYLVMEYAPHGSLREYEVTDFAQFRATMLGILDGLACAHARDVIHRDLKPENVLLCERGGGTLGWVISDFGIAQAGDARHGTDTVEMQARAGTPWYMSPEQLTGRWRDAGPWTDLYALGALAYELASGRPPFDSDSLVDLARRHLTEPVPPFVANFEIPGELRRWIETLLDKDHTRRFRCAADAAAALLSFSGDAPSPRLLSRRDVDAPVPTVTAMQTLPLPPSPSDEVRRPPQREVASPPTPRRTWPSPSLPPTWRTRDDASARIESSLGLGLFGLREVPFVGREQEKALLWETLLDVASRRKPRTVVVEGDVGTGKSQLARAFGHRARELGAATVVWAPHAPGGSAYSGLSALVKKAFSLWGLEREPRLQRLRTVLAELEPSLASDEFASKMEAMVLDDLIEPGRSKNPSTTHSTDAERRATSIRLLERMSRERPLVVVVDDVQWGPELLPLVGDIHRQGELPVLFVVTARTAGRSPELQDELDALTARADVARTALEPLDVLEQFELLDRMLHLRPDVRRSIAHRTQGNPLFAIQLLGSWVDGGRLVYGPDGFSPAGDHQDDLPSDIHEVWRERLETILASIPPDRRESHTAVLELAAFLGPKMEWLELREAARAAGIQDVDYSFADRLAEQDLARTSPWGVSFVHLLFCESLRRFARDAGRAEAHHLACAKALTKVGDPRVDGLRIGEHWIAAGRWREASSPLFAVALASRVAGDEDRAARAMERLEEVQRALADDEVIRMRRRQLELFDRQRRGENLDDVELLELLEEARRHDAPDVAFHVLKRFAIGYRRRGEFDNALECLDEAVTIAEQMDEPRFAAEALRMSAQTQLYRGHLDDAERRLEQSESWANRALGEAETEAVVRAVSRGRLLIERGDYEAARDVLVRARSSALDAQQRTVLADIYNELGDVDRLLGQWESARTNLQSAILVQALLGTTSLVPRANLALVSVFAGDYQTARSMLNDLVEEVAAEGKRYWLPVLQLALACCAAASRDWDSWDELFESAREQFTAMAYFARDVAVIAEHAARLAADGGQPTRAAAAQGLAEAQWEGLRTES